MSAPGGNGTGTAPLARNDFRDGQVLRARDLERESGYFLARDRQHAALAHGQGILFGLQVTAVKQGTDEAVSPAELHEARQKNVTVPLDLFITSGAAIDGFGRMIIVPGREQLRTDLATEPSPLRSGTYRLELLYQREVQGGADRPGGGCGAGAGAGGALVREGYRCRLVEDTPRPAPTASVLDGPPDSPEAETPVTLGTVTWRTELPDRGFVGYSDRGRAYVGVRAQQLRTPDDRMELGVSEPTGGLAVRFAELPPPDAEAPFTPGPLEDRFRIDPSGEVWTAGGVSMDPSGITLRSEPNTEPTGPWSASLWNAREGAPFEKYAEKYEVGQRELRIAIERGGTKEGKQRVVVGYVAGVEFRPAVVVYDAAPDNAHPEQVVVEIWGDLHVRGVAHLTGVQRIPPEKEKGDELDKLLAHMAGPLGGALRAVLVTDEKYMEALGTRLAGSDALRDRIAARDEFIDSVSGKLVRPERVGPLARGVAAELLLSSSGFVSGVAERAAAPVADVLAKDDEDFLPAVVEHCLAELSGDANVEKLTKDVVTWLGTSPGHPTLLKLAALLQAAVVPEGGSGPAAPP